MGRMKKSALRAEAIISYTPIARQRLFDHAVTLRYIGLRWHVDCTLL